MEALRLSRVPLNDDQLAVKASVTPRQTVNIICRQLRDAGVIDRVSGPDGKIVNVLKQESPLVDGLKSRVVGPVKDAGGIEVTAPAGHSREQRLAETYLLAGLAQTIGRPLAPATIRLPSGVRVEVDGADDDRTVLVECWAHIGGVKGAQRLKVLTDAFKLTWIATNIPGRPRLILCMADDEAAAPFRNQRAWFGQALADQSVEIVVVPLPEDVRAAVMAAQRRQYR